MDLNLLSKYVNNENSSSSNIFKNFETPNVQGENDNQEGLYSAFSDELSILAKNGFKSNIDAYRNAATGVTTVAIGLSQEETNGNYVLVKNKWDDNKWDMTILKSNKGDELAPHSLNTSLWLAARGYANSDPDQICIKGLTIEEVLKLCE